MATSRATAAFYIDFVLSVAILEIVFLIFLVAALSIITLLIAIVDQQLSGGALFFHRWVHISRERGK
jgi:hypothetical protein